MKEIIPAERIDKRILVLRDRRVLLDADLAVLYGVDTRTLIQALKRNIARFPDDFMFQLTPEEFAFLRSQNVISKLAGRGGRRYPPYAFTEHGVAMLASVLNSPRAIEVSVLIVRVFVRMREALTASRELAHKLAELEQRLDTHDEAIQSLMAAIRSLMTPPEQRRRRIGFVRPDQNAGRKAES